MKTSMMITSLKMEKRKKIPNKINIKMGTHQTGKLIQVTKSPKINNKTTKKTPPLKMTAQKK